MEKCLYLVVGKTYFWYSKGTVDEITISNHYIVGNESYRIHFHFPKKLSVDFFDTLFSLCQYNEWVRERYLLRIVEVRDCLGWCLDKMIDSLEEVLRDSPTNSVVLLRREGVPSEPLAEAAFPKA